MLLDRLGPPGRGSGWRPHGGEGAGGDALSYGVSFATTRPPQLAEGGSVVLSLRHCGLVLFIPWRVGAEEAGAAKFGSMASAGGLSFFVTPYTRAREVFLNSQCRRDAARPAPAAWAVQRLLAARWRGRRRRRRRFGLSDFRFEAAAATRSATGSASPRPDRTSWLRGAPACFLSGISGWFSLSLGAWVPKKLARRSLEVWLRRGR